MHTDRLRYSMGVGMGILYRFPYKIPYVKKLQTLQFVDEEDSPLDDSDTLLVSLLLDFAITRQAGHVLGLPHAQLFQNGQEVQQRGLTGREDGFNLVGGGDFGRAAIRD